MERHVAPANPIRQLATFPPFGSELVRVGPVQVFAAVQVVGHEADADAGGDEDGGGATWPTAMGQVGGSGGDAVVDGDGGVEAEGWWANRGSLVGWMDVRGSGQDGVRVRVRVRVSYALSFRTHFR